MKIKQLLLAVSIMLLSACASQTFNINDGKTSEYPTEQSSQTFFVSGIGQEKTINAAKVCSGAENVIKVESQKTFVNGLLGVLTFGIYTPRDVKVYCKQ